MHRVQFWVVPILFLSILSACSGPDSTNNPDSNSDSDQASTDALSAEVLELAKLSGCLACHALDEKIVGPAWRDVAMKYRGDDTAIDRLIAKVKAGGKGAWGDVPMPPYSPRVPDADIKTLVVSILGVNPLPTESVSGSVMAGQSIEHNTELVAGVVYTIRAEATAGDVDIAVYAVNDSGDRNLIEAAQHRGHLEQLTIAAPKTGSYVVAVNGVLDSQYTLTVAIFGNEEFLQLAAQSGCLACHSIEKQVVGPAFAAVAEKYRDVATAKAILIGKVSVGGKGVWGDVPMPPYSPRVSDGDIERLVVYVRTLTGGSTPAPVPEPVPGPPKPVHLPARPMAVSKEQFLELAKTSGCLACHAIEKKVIGPAWLDVANHYDDSGDTFDTLVNKIRMGGAGNWGATPMPPYSPRIADTVIAQLVANILALDFRYTFPVPSGSWSVSGYVALGDTDLSSFVGKEWTVYSVDLISVTGDADLSVFKTPGGVATKSLIGRSDSTHPRDRVVFSTEAVSDNFEIEVYGYLPADYGLTVRPEKLVLPDPQPPTEAQFVNYDYSLSDATRALANSSGCLACHAESTPVLGPSFKAISLRFKDVAGSQSRLTDKIKTGGKGMWGDLPMPPYFPRVSDADIDILVQSILFGDPLPESQ